MMPTDFNYKGQGMIHVIIGLTGKTGSGKSTAAGFLKDEGFLVVDFDRISRETTKKGSPCLKEIEQCFGSVVIDENGELKRKLLGQIVFSDTEKLELLNSITHKYILAMAYDIKNANKDKNLIFDAPLLFEAGLDAQCDYVIGVVAPLDERVKRICLRDNISEENALNRIRNQKPDSFFRENCDYILENEKDPKDLKLELQKILRSIFHGNNI